MWDEISPSHHYSRDMNGIAVRSEARKNKGWVFIATAESNRAPLSVQSVMGTAASKELTSSGLSAQHRSQCSKDRMRKDSSWYKLRSIKAPSQSRV